MVATAKNKPESPKQPLGALAYDRICRKIIMLDYEPGRILDEKQLMADLCLGRTPVREALLRLAGEGWVESQPNRGAVVPAITLQGTKAVFEAMKILEVGVAGLAVGQNISSIMPQMVSASDLVRAAVESGDVLGLVEANHVFHLHFASCSRNEFVIRAVMEVRNQAKRLAYLSYANEIDPRGSLPAHYDSVVREHGEIIASLREKDEARLREIVVRHINTFQQRIVAYMTS
jgi:DNA-binding GntR family transcriptional regulator